MFYLIAVAAICFIVHIDIVKGQGYAGRRYRTKRPKKSTHTDSAPFYSVIKKNAQYNAANEGISIQQESLNTALLKWNLFNNGYYTFQIAQTCNCPICDIQSMNIYIENNVIVNSEYTEGNEYALNNFCGNDDILYNERLSFSRITIYDLFNIIQASIADNINIGVIYHEDIGIPLSISIQPLDNEILNTFISINCIAFNASYPSIAATDIRGRKRYNVFETVSIADFNSNDAYSCPNIRVPAQCIGVNDHFKCSRITDGCNTCSCDVAGDAMHCTKRVCVDRETVIKCIDCASNTQWTDCGGDADCIPDCNSMDNFCGHAPFSAVLNCNPRCQCPADRPRWNGDECISLTECDIQMYITDGGHADGYGGNINAAAASICIPHCNVYTDGCVECECSDDTPNGQIIGDCVRTNDTCSAEDRQCELCEDPNTMIYTQCGAADVSCGDRNTFVEVTQCTEKCECKSEFPIYDANNKKCITVDECPDITDTETTDVGPFGRCIEHCAVYYDGCNACQCPGVRVGDKGLDFCTDLKCAHGAIGGASKTCFGCELKEMEYVLCGKCDRTCNDPQPACLQSDKCLEKCQCPLYAPIYEDGKCVSFQQCTSVVKESESAESGESSEDEARVHHKIRDEDELSTQDNNVVYHDVSQYHWPWEKVVVYAIIVIICIVSVVALLFWPRVFLTRWRMEKYTQRIGVEDGGKVEAEEDDIDFMGDLEPLSHKPDGMVLAKIPEMGRLP